MMGKLKYSRFLFAVLGAACTLSLVALSIFRLGIPITLYTWFVVTLCAVSGATLALDGVRQWFAFLGSALVCFYLVTPEAFRAIPLVENWALFDDVGGRSGWGITPGLQFGKDGPNTKLMETLVGPLEANWW